MAVGNKETSAEKIEAGRYTLDLRRARLFVDGKPVELRAQSFEVLRELVEQQGELLTKKALFDAIWGDVAVTDDSLTHCVAEIRQALGDHDRTIIRTVPRRGYVFQGDGGHEEPTAPGRPRLRIAAVALFLAAAITWFASLNEQSTAVVESRPSIAVLPFEDMTASQDKQHLGEGLSEEILNLLARSDDLRVIARTSSFRLAETGAGISTIADTLGVSHVIEGSVRQGDDRLRITVQLIDAGKNIHLWSETYDRPIGDILEIQSSVARAVTDTLHVVLDLPLSASASGVDPRAHALVIQAQSMLRLLDPVDNQRAQDLLEQALAIDPDNVQAHIRLSQAVYQARGSYGDATFLVSLRRAQELTDAALRLDPDNAIANAQRGWIELHFNHDFEKAARYYEHATALEPRNLDVIRSLVNASVIFSRPDIGVQLGEYLVARDPLCIVCYAQLGLAARVSGNHSLALDANRKALALDPENGNSHERYGRALLLVGDYEAALESLARQTRENAGMLMDQAIANLRLGNHSEFEHFRQRAIEKFGESSPSAIARIEAEAGNIDAAFGWLERRLELPAYRRGVDYLSPYYDNLRDDPRWDHYLERFGLSPAQLDAIGFNPTLPF